MKNSKLILWGGIAGAIVLIVALLFWWWSNSATCEGIPTIIPSQNPAVVNTPVSFSLSGVCAKSLSWDFDGDGESDATGEAPSWTFKEMGEYTVTVTLDGDARRRIPLRLAVSDNCPFAKFEIPAVVADGEEVAFVNRSNLAASYSWTFDDGTKSTEASPTHIFHSDKQTETFRVTLTITPQGNACAPERLTFTFPVEVAKAPVVFEVSKPADGVCHKKGEKVTLSTSVADIARYAWTIEGKTYTIEKVEHQLLSPGLAKPVTLTVKLKNGRMGSGTQKMNVCCIPVPKPGDAAEVARLLVAAYRDYDGAAGKRLQEILAPPSETKVIIGGKTMTLTAFAQTDIPATLTVSGVVMDECKQIRAIKINMP